MSTPTTHDWPTSALAAAAAAYAKLTCEPDPLSLDLDQLDPQAGLPAGVMTLPDLSAWLVEHQQAYAARDAVWRTLVYRARTAGPHWVIAAVGMAMPALIRYASQHAADYRGDSEDIDSEVLTGFLNALRERVDPDLPAPHAVLCMSAWRAGYDLVCQSLEYQPVGDLDHVTGPRTPRIPWGHPDLLVRRAVQLGLVDEQDEQPYIDVRLGHHHIGRSAEGLGISLDAMKRRLERIDTRLAAALAAGLLSDVVAPAARRELTSAALRRLGIRASAAGLPAAA